MKVVLSRLCFLLGGPPRYGSEEYPMLWWSEAASMVVMGRWRPLTLYPDLKYAMADWGLQPEPGKGGNASLYS